MKGATIATHSTEEEGRITRGNNNTSKSHGPPVTHNNGKSYGSSNYTNDMSRSRIDKSSYEGDGLHQSQIMYDSHGLPLGSTTAGDTFASCLLSNENTMNSNERTHSGKNMQMDGNVDTMGETPMNRSKYKKGMDDIGHGHGGDRGMNTRGEGNHQKRMTRRPQEKQTKHSVVDNVSTGASHEYTHMNRHPRSNRSTHSSHASYSMSTSSQSGSSHQQPRSYQQSHTHTYPLPDGYSLMQDTPRVPASPQGNGAASTPVHPINSSSPKPTFSPHLNTSPVVPYGDHVLSSSGQQPPPTVQASPNMTMHPWNPHSNAGSQLYPYPPPNSAPNTIHTGTPILTSTAHILQTGSTNEQLHPSTAPISRGPAPFYPPNSQPPVTNATPPSHTAPHAMHLVSPAPQYSTPQQLTDVHRQTTPHSPYAINSASYIAPQPIQHPLPHSHRDQRGDTIQSSHSRVVVSSRSSDADTVYQQSNQSTDKMPPTAEKPTFAVQKRLTRHRIKNESTTILLDTEKQQPSTNVTHNRDVDTRNATTTHKIANNSTASNTVKSGNIQELTNRGHVNPSNGTVVGQPKKASETPTMGSEKAVDETTSRTTGVKESSQIEEPQLSTNFQPTRRSRKVLNIADVSPSYSKLANDILFFKPEKLLEEPHILKDSRVKTSTAEHEEGLMQPLSTPPIGSKMEVLSAVIVEDVGSEKYTTHVETASTTRGVDTIQTNTLEEENMSNNAEVPPVAVVTSEDVHQKAFEATADVKRGPTTKIVEESVCMQQSGMMVDTTSAAFIQSTASRMTAVQSSSHTANETNIKITSENKAAVNTTVQEGSVGRLLSDKGTEKNSEGMGSTAIKNTGGGGIEVSCTTAAVSVEVNQKSTMPSNNMKDTSNNSTVPPILADIPSSVDTMEKDKEGVLNTSDSMDVVPSTTGISPPSEDSSQVVPPISESIAAPSLVATPTTTTSKQQPPLTGEVPTPRRNQTDDLQTNQTVISDVKSNADTSYNKNTIIQPSSHNTQNTSASNRLHSEPMASVPKKTVVDVSSSSSTPMYTRDDLLKCFRIIGRHRSSSRNALLQLLPSLKGSGSSSHMKSERVLLPKAPVVNIEQHLGSGDSWRGATGFSKDRGMGHLPTARGLPSLRTSSTAKTNEPLVNSIPYRMGAASTVVPKIIPEPKITLKPKFPGFFKTKENLTVIELLRRDLKSLLNKLTIENFKVVGEKIANRCENLMQSEELQLLVDLIYDKAVIEPDYCDMYADLCLVLRWRSKPSLRNRGLEKGFQWTLNCRTETEFIMFPKVSLEPTEEELTSLSESDREVVVYKRKLRVLGNIRFLGHLIVRRLMHTDAAVEAATILLIVDEKTGKYPDEHFIECAIELFTNIGYFLEKLDGGGLLDKWMSIFEKHMNSGVYSKRICCKIQDLLDIRKNRWSKKIFKEQAKSVAEIREDAIRDQKKGGSIILAQLGAYATVGDHEVQHRAYYSYLLEQYNLFQLLKESKGNSSSQPSLGIHKPTSAMNEDVKMSSMSGSSYNDLSAAAFDASASSSELVAPSNIPDNDNVGVEATVDDSNAILFGSLQSMKSERHGMEQEESTGGQVVNAVAEPSVNVETTASINDEMNEKDKLMREGVDTSFEGRECRVVNTAPNDTSSQELSVEDENKGCTKERRVFDEDISTQQKFNDAAADKTEVMGGVEQSSRSNNEWRMCESQKEVIERASQDVVSGNAVEATQPCQPPPSDTRGGEQPTSGGDDSSFF